MEIGTAAHEGWVESHLSGKNIESTFLSLLLESHVYSVALCGSLVASCMCVVCALPLTECFEDKKLWSNFVFLQDYEHIF